MPAPTITPLPNPPSRSQSPDTFSADADAFLGALPEFVSDANAQASYLDGIASGADADATTAAAAAAAALVSENNAAASEENAAASEAAALASANSAAASYDSFDDRYLGSKANDPSVDNDGNPLLTGALYWNSTSNQMRVYSGSSWEVAYLPASAYVQGPASSTDGNLAVFDGTTGKVIKNGGTLANYVQGPASATTNTIPLYDGATGKLLKSDLGSGASGQALVSGGAGQPPVWSTIESGSKVFTSSGAITAGQAVSINSNGTVSTTTGVNQTAVFDTTQYTSGPSTYSFASYFDVTTGYHIQILASGNGLYIYVLSVSATGAVTTKGTSYLYNVGARYTAAIAKDTVNNRFALMTASSSASPQLHFFTINSSGTVSTVVTATVSPAIGGQWCLDVYYDSYADRYVTFHYIGSNQLRATAINYNAGSPTATATSNISTDGSANVSVSCAYNSNVNGGIVFYTAQSTGYTASVSVSLNAAGNTFTFGSQVNVDTNGFYYRSRCCYMPNIDRYVLQYYAGGSIYTRVINPSTRTATGTSTSAPSSTAVNWQGYGFTPSYDTTNSVVYCSGGDGTNINVWKYTLTASSVIYGLMDSKANAGLSYSYGSQICFDPINVRATVYTYEVSANVGYTIGYLPTYFSSNADKFVGFAAQSVSTGQSVSVTILGGTNNNQTSLTTGTAYYLKFDGTLTTSATPYGIVARAVSATSATVITGGAFKKFISQTVISGSPSSITISLPTGYSQFEISLQSIRGGTTGNPAISSVNSSGGSNSWYGRGTMSYSTTTSYYSQSASLLYLTSAVNHTANQPLGGNIILQSSSGGLYWSYSGIISFYNGGDALSIIAGYSSDAPASITFTGFGTLSNSGVITLYGVG